ncbi:hypothetical protein BGX24_008347 [Mortierella sp. AD032]|nr:hypothetical protein BGX24_008347 [Mortierella sp. AD032]
MPPEFCKNNKATYSGVDGKDLFLVDSEDKLIAFMKEYYFDKTSKKHVKRGADFKALVPVKFGPDGQPLPLGLSALVNMLEETEVDKNGCKVISIPLGKGSLQLAKKVLGRLHSFQFKHNQLSCSSPTEGSKYQDTLQRYRDAQVQQNLQSSRIRSADCAIRDSYSLTKFNDMVSSLWEKKSQEFRDPDLNYREQFCMTSRHNMLLLDEDLRNLHLSDCFASIFTKPRHPGSQQLVSLAFKLEEQDQP